MVKNQCVLMIALFILIGCLAFVILQSSNKDIYFEMQHIDEQVLDRDITMYSQFKVRSLETKISAIEKFIGGNGALIMFHYASCCKSMLSSWFDKIKDKLNKGTPLWNSSIQHIEITDDFHYKFGTKRIESLIASNPDTVFVICFDDPIKRILAQYDKTWRWFGDETRETLMEQYNQSLLTMNNYLNTKKHKDTERFAAIDLNDFLYRIVKFEIEQNSKNEKLYQMFVNNYYLWSFCCWNKECNILKYNDIEHCIGYSLDIIRSFDIVFIKDWIRDLRVQHYINELFFTNNNVDDQTNKFVAVDKKSYKVSKIGTNYMFDPDNEALLRIINKYDFKLYQSIRDLVFNRTHIVWQRAKYNKNNRNELVYDLGYKQILMRSN